MQHPIRFAIAAVLLAAGCTPKTENAAPPPDALARAEENLRNAPSFENHIALGLEYANRGMREQALTMYVKAKDMTPSSPLAWNNICAELNAQGRHGEAVVHCRKSVELDPNFQLARNNLAWTENRLRESKDGIVERKKATLARKDAGGAELMALGFEFYNLQDYANAAEVWSAIKAGDPEYSKAQNNLATAYILTEQLDKAQHHITLALTLEPNNQLYKNNQAWLAQKKAEKQAR